VTFPYKTSKIFFFAFLIGPVRTLYLACLILIDLIILIFGEEYKVWDASSGNFLQPPFSHPFLFSKSLNLCSFPERLRFTSKQNKYLVRRWPSSGLLHRVVWYKFTDGLEVLAAFTIRAMIASIIALMLEAVSTSKTSVNFCHSTLLNSPEYNSLHNRRCTNLKSREESGNTEYSVMKRETGSLC
jgi:hypothetical protein